MGKKLFWSRDRLVKHEFDCLGCVRVRVRVVVRISNNFGVKYIMVRVPVKVGIRNYVKLFCSAEKLKKP